MRRSGISQRSIDYSHNLIGSRNPSPVWFVLRLGGGLLGDPGQPRQPGAQHRQRRVRLLPAALRRPDPGARGLRQRGVQRDHVLRQAHLKRWDTGGRFPPCWSRFAQTILLSSFTLGREFMN